MQEIFFANVLKEFADTSQEGNVRWVQAFPYDTWSHSRYGETTVDQSIATQYVQNFKNNVRGQDLPINYMHGEDLAKGSKAAGWIKDMEARQNGLFVQVEFTPTALQEIKNGEWRYLSSEIYDSWTHPHTKAEHKNVFVGAGLTNLPHVKGMLPINFSEVLSEEEVKEFAATATAPYGNVEYADTGFQKDGKKRYPLDTEAHIRAAWSYINQAKNAAFYSASNLATVKSRIVAAMKRIGADVKAMSEDQVEVWLNTHQFSEAELLEVIGESKEWEHSEPGTGSPPAPRTDEDGSDDLAIRTGSRREIPPNTIEVENREGGNVLTDAQLEELRRMYDLPVDADGEKLVTAAKLQFGELNEFKANRDKGSQEKKFREEYPAVWAEHNEMMERDRMNTAKTFSESVSKVHRMEGKGLKTTKLGMSALAKEELEKFHKSFAEEAATVADFESLMKTIFHGGLVEFGEIGSGVEKDELPTIDTTTQSGVLTARKMFSDQMQKIMVEDGLDANAAFNEAAKKFPDLYEAWNQPVHA